MEMEVEAAMSPKIPKVTQASQRFEHSLVLVFGSIILVLSLTLLGSSWIYFYDVVNKSEDDLASMLARGLSTSTNKVSFSGRYHTQLLLEEYLEQNPELVFIVIQLDDGEVFAEASRCDTKPLLRGETWERARKAKGTNLVVQILEVEGQSVREVASPYRVSYQGVERGVIRLGISRQRVVESFSRSFSALTLLGFSLAIFMTVLVVVASKRLSAPVQTLADEFKAILDHTPTSIFLYASDGELIRSSSDLALLYGLNETPQSVDDIYSQYDAATLEILRESDKVLLKGELASCREERQLTILGELKDIALTRFPLLDSQQICAFAVDVTARRQLERSLLQGRKMDSIGHFAGGIAHDFNNVLCGIMGYSDLLAMQTDGASKKIANEILNSAKIGADLTKRLLSFGRQQVVIRKPVDLRSILTRSESLVRRLLRSNLTLEISLPSAEVGARVDHSQIEQVILNLVANARDAMPGPGMIQLILDTIDVEEDWRLGTKQLSAGQYARLRVSDEGSGLAPELRETLFDPFVTSKAIGKGTGLGLSIVYSIATAHDGAIGCENNPERGATFTIVFPLSKEPLEKIEAVPAQQQSVPMKALRILIADDQEEIRAFLDLGLQRLGMTVTLTADGEAAINAFDESDTGFDVILLDAIMPKKGGVLCYRHVRKKLPELPILFMSGYDNQALGQILAADERASYISKPFTVEALQEKLGRLLKTDN